MLYRKLVSEYYDLAYPNADKKELAFWLEHSLHAKGNVLELGCGTGRILIPLLSRNIKIMGIDSSGQMLARCREKCSKLNLQAALYEQSMEELDLPYKFDLIFIPDGTIGFVTGDEELKKVFKKIFFHLTPGGKLIFDILPPRGKNLEEKYGVWTGDWKRANDNIIYVKRTMIMYKPDSCLRECLLIIEKFVDGTLVSAEEDFGVTRFFEPDEIINFLCETGFVEITACDWLSDKPVKSDSVLATIKCAKPA